MTAVRRPKVLSSRTRTSFAADNQTYSESGSQGIDIWMQWAVDNATISETGGYGTIGSHSFTDTDNGSDSFDLINILSASFSCTYTQVNSTQSIISGNASTGSYSYLTTTDYSMSIVRAATRPSWGRSSTGSRRTQPQR